MKDCGNCGGCPRGMESDEHGSIYYCEIFDFTFHPHLLTDQHHMENCKSWRPKGQEVLLEGMG